MPRQASERREKKYSMDECLDALEAMQGGWVDGKGVTYDLKDRRVRRNSDGRTFLLHVRRGFIDWGAAGKYYARPSSNIAKKIKWLHSRNGAVAWVWTRRHTRASD